MSRIFNRIKGLLPSGRGRKRKARELPEALTGGARQATNQTIKGQSVTCSFCQRLCTKDHSDFNFLAKVGEALICSRCITYAYARMSLGTTLDMNWSGPGASILKLSMERSVAGYPGSVRIKKAAVELAIRICTHCSTVNMSRQGRAEPPKPLRLCVKGGDPSVFYNLLKCAVERAGIIAYATTVCDYNEGKTKAALMSACRDDKIMLDYAVIFVKDGSVLSDEKHALICATDSPYAVKLDGMDEIELG